MGRMVEVQVLVHVGGFPLDCDLQAAVTLPPEWCVQEWKYYVLLDFHNELDEPTTAPSLCSKKASP